MDHNNHGYVSHNKMVVQSFSQQQTPKKPGQVLSRYYLEPGDPRSRFTGPIEHSYFGENQWPINWRRGWGTNGYHLWCQEAFSRSLLGQSFRMTTQLNHPRMVAFCFATYLTSPDGNWRPVFDCVIKQPNSWDVSPGSWGSQTFEIRSNKTFVFFGGLCQICVGIEKNMKVIFIQNLVAFLKKVLLSINQYHER